MRSALFLMMFALSLLLAGPAYAGGLSEYKDQKHSQREEVTKQSCEKDYTARCVARECEEGDAACRRDCARQAPNFCEKRTRRRRRKQAEVVAKGASVGAGAAAVLIAKKAEDYVDLPEGTAAPDAYTLYWDRPSAIGELGAGYLLGNVLQGSVGGRLRLKWFGVSGQVHYLNDLEESLTEADVGPTFHMASTAFGLTFAAQPSLLVSAAPDVETMYGVGLRSYTDLLLGRRVLLNFEPMLGYINGQWSYHVRVGGTYRVTPRVFLKLTYDYRDILDLNDLDISQSRLQGVVGLVGFRFN